jgi:micrococcal nuclease
MRLTEKNVGAAIVIIGLVWLAVSLSQGSSTATDQRQASETHPVATPETSRKTSGRTACRVLSVYDGDTFACDLNGNHKIDKPREMIRLLGIDTPEMHYSRKNQSHDTEHETDEPGAKMASQWLDKTLFRKTVYLEFDQRKRDRYDRTLAYAYLSAKDGVSINEQMLAQGYAKILFLGKNRRYEERFTDVEAQAREKKLGMWRL